MAVTKGAANTEACKPTSKRASRLRSRRLHYFNRFLDRSPGKENTESGPKFGRAPSDRNVTFASTSSTQMNADGSPENTDIESGPEFGRAPSDRSLTFGKMVSTRSVGTESGPEFGRVPSDRSVSFGRMASTRSALSFGRVASEKLQSCAPCVLGRWHHEAGDSITIDVMLDEHGENVVLEHALVGKERIPFHEFQTGSGEFFFMDFTGVMSEDGNEILWSNGLSWFRPGYSRKLIEG